MLDGGLMPILPETISGVDLIIFTEVIEHINNPNEVLSYIYNILNNNGLLFITTPNFESIERYVLGPEWGMIMYPEHVCYYSPNTLDKILHNHGFKKIQIYSENISVYRIFQYINRNRSNLKTEFDAEGLSAKAQAIATNNRIAKLMKNSINTILKLTNSGSSIVAMYRKSN